MSSAADQFKHVPIDEVRESSTNPRRHFDKKGLEELTASVQTKGILVPLLVVSRQNKGEEWFEIVAGARRYRAAKAAGLAQLPVIVRQLSAEEVLEAQVIENLQREDVHPLDEAKGYEALMKEDMYGDGGLFEAEKGLPYESEIEEDDQFDGS